MNFIPITIRLFGISLSLLVPNNRILIFFFGTLFWIITGPIIKYTCKKLLSNLGSLIAEDVNKEKINYDSKRN